MSPRIRPRRRLMRYVYITTLAGGLTAVAYVASAASLGGSSAADLMATSSSETVELPLAFDHFDGCAGNLNNDSDVVGNNWLAPSTDWRCQSAYSRSRNRNLATTADTATVDVAQSDDLTVSTYLMQTSRTASGAGSGVSLFHDGSSYHMYVVYQRGADVVTLGKVDGSGDTEIVSMSFTPRTNTIELVVDISQPNIAISANGTLLGTHVMTAAEIATFGSNTRFGMESDLDRRSRWDWFRVENTP